MTSHKIEHVAKLDEWFFQNLSGIKCSDESRAYVAGVLATFRSAKNDLSNVSISIAYLEAKDSGKFALYQKVGDWILWTSMVHPVRFDVEKKLYESIVRMSYESCHRILLGKWKLYDELATNFVPISQSARCKLESNLVIF